MTGQTSRPPRTLDHIVVMGVSGVGKSTVGRELADITGWDYAEGDDFHPAANVAKMAAGHPLTDEDRWPWLVTVGEWISAEAAQGRSAIVTCSALKRSYRDLLREGRPTVRFCHLVGDALHLSDRLEHRAGHFMPSSLLGSQLDTLEPLAPDEPGVDVSMLGSRSDVLARAVTALGLAQPAGPPSTAAGAG